MDALSSFRVKRHQLRTTWGEVIRRPQSPGKDYKLRLPFKSSYLNAFRTMVDWSIRPFPLDDGSVTVYLQETGHLEDAPETVHDWVRTVSEYVAMRDFLAVSFALDFEHVAGNPNEPKTEIGRLRRTAKIYGAAAPSKATFEAADCLVERCESFLDVMTCYRTADAVVAMPPSDPGRRYTLPGYIAGRLADDRRLTNLSMYVRTVVRRASLKGICVEAKLETIKDTIHVDATAFRGKHVLIIDDLYQSGISMNYFALQLLDAGAEVIYGLSCEKTCRNDDNVSEGT